MKTGDEKNENATEERKPNRDKLSGNSVAEPAGPELGAVVGGQIGEGKPRKIDSTAEEVYWQSNYANRPYVDKSKPYEAYRPAYRAGYVGYESYAGKSFEEAEGDLQQHYYSNRDTSDLEWEHARHASRDAWERVKSQQANTTGSGKELR